MSEFATILEHRPGAHDLDMGPVPEPRRCFVLVLDILGYKNLRGELGVRELAERYRNVLAAVLSNIGSGSARSLRPLIDGKTAEDRAALLASLSGIQGFDQASLTLTIPHYEQITYGDVSVFSDTVFVFTKTDGMQAREEILDVSNVLFRAFLMEGMPSRGVIAKGECVVWPSASVFVGKPIEDAYLLGERFEGVGVICHESMGEMAERDTEWSPAVAWFKPGHWWLPLKPERRLVPHMNPVEIRSQIRLTMQGQDPGELDEVLLRLRDQAARVGNRKAVRKYDRGDAVCSVMLDLHRIGPAPWSPDWKARKRANGRRFSPP